MIENRSECEIVGALPGGSDMGLALGSYRETGLHLHIGRSSIHGMKQAPRAPPDTEPESVCGDLAW